MFLAVVIVTRSLDVHLDLGISLSVAEVTANRPRLQDNVDLIAMCVRFGRDLERIAAMMDALDFTL